MRHRSRTNPPETSQAMIAIRPNDVQDVKPILEIRGPCPVLTVHIVVEPRARPKSNQSWLPYPLSGDPFCLLLPSGPGTYSRPAKLFQLTNVVISG